MKYILPIVNCVIICTLSLMMNFRDDTPIIGQAISSTNENCSLVLRSL